MHHGEGDQPNRPHDRRHGDEGQRVALDGGAPGAAVRRPAQQHRQRLPSSDVRRRGAAWTPAFMPAQSHLWARRAVCCHFAGGRFVRLHCPFLMNKNLKTLNLFCSLYNLRNAQ